MEMTVAIEEMAERIPDFRLDPAGRVTWSEEPCAALASYRCCSAKQMEGRAELI